jgi:acyl-coenzyme A thioesterase PaaI-like protein
MVDGTGQMTAQVATQFVHASVPAIGRLGVIVDEISPGEVVLRVPIEGNTNHMGTMYAGALFAVAELPGGLLPLVVLGAGRYVPILVEMRVQYTAAARTDVTLRASLPADEVGVLAARADVEGQAQFTLALDGQDASGRTVIRSEASYVLRPART